MSLSPPTNNIGTGEKMLKITPWSGTWVRTARKGGGKCTGERKG